MPTRYNTSSLPSQAGKRFLITGANSGIGFYAAVGLARLGANVLLACRDQTRGQAALKLLSSEVPNASAELLNLDLSSLASVEALAQLEGARGLPLDGLINNAGVMAPPTRKLTKDGFELQFGTNVLGHFALTGRLLPMLEQAASPRVVWVASIAHKRGAIAFDDLQGEKHYNPRSSYSQSKLADLMLSFELERRLRSAGSKVTSIAVHPGVAETKIVKFGSGEGLLGQAESLVASIIGTLLNSGPGGALPTVFAATSPDARGGGYYGPQGLAETRGNDVGDAFVSAAAQDAAAQAKLWSVCAELTGIDLP